MRLRTLPLAVLLFMLAVPAAAAQQPPAVRHGTPVRLSADGASLEASGRLARAARTDLADASVSRAPSGSLVTGAAIGFVVGAGATAAVLYSGGSTSICDAGDNQDAIGTGACVALVAGGGLVGAAIGAGVAALVRGDSSEPTAAESIRVAVLPRRDGRAAWLVGVSAAM